MNKKNTFKIYADYFENFMTLQCCAEYYGITLASMRRIHRYYKAREHLTWGELAKASL